MQAKEEKANEDGGGKGAQTKSKKEDQAQ